MPDNPRRTTSRFTIDATLLCELKARAAAHGISVERYVDQVLLEALPRILADVMTNFVARSIELAAEYDNAKELDHSCQCQPVPFTGCGVSLYSKFYASANRPRPGHRVEAPTCGRRQKR